MKFIKYALIIVINLSCNYFNTKPQLDKRDTLLPNASFNSQSIFKNASHDTTTASINKVQDKNLAITEDVTHELVRFAKTLIGTPYKYASIDPAIGFDCSGFITYVFTHFHVNVPRSSVDFTNIGTQINLTATKEGDLILFTGTNESIRTVGHMGIVTENSDTLRFIHSTSGRAYGVTISKLTEQYKKRFVKVIRISSN